MYGVLEAFVEIYVVGGFKFRFCFGRLFDSVNNATRQTL